MKKINFNVREKVCSFQSLYIAMNKCKRNVMWKGSVAGFVKNGLANCQKLSDQLTNNKYSIDEYTIFTVYEPKKRDIVSTRFKDRVFQRSLCDNYLYKTMTKGFIYDNCACQINKGVDFAMNRLDTHLHRFFRKHKLNGYILKCDISNYFGSTSHNVAKAAVRNRVDDDWAYEMVCQIIDSFNQGADPEVGMGLGSQVTQLIQLAVLDDLDHMIKEKLQIKQYIRYMDDFILIHEDKDYLQYCLGEIHKRLKDIGLKLSEKKTQLFPIKQGIKFLGFHFYLTETGKVIRKISRDNISNERRKLKKLFQRVKDGIMTYEDVECCFTSWQAHLARGNTYNIVQKTKRYFNNLMEECKNYEIQNNSGAT